MYGLDRRRFLEAVLAAAAGLPLRAAGKAPGARVIVVGGGFGGAAAAKYLRLLDAGIAVTLVTNEREYFACPMSSEVLIGARDLAEQRWSHEGLARYGVAVHYAEVAAVDPVKKIVVTRDGRRFGGELLVLAPGIDFDWKAVEGYHEGGAEIMPHAWKAGGQTLLLRRQIEAMRDGGTVLIVVPPRPIRCPPAPYERAALIAYYLKRHKPKGKVVVLDANDWFPMQKLFEREWARHYGPMITWVPAAAGGKAERVDLSSRTVYSEFDKYTGDVVNFIPRQHAGAIALQAGLTDASGWCPVKAESLESTLHTDVYIAGDACGIREMSKTAHGAVSHAKVIAGAIAAKIAGKPPPTPYYSVVGYLMITPEFAFSGTQVLRVKNGAIETVENAGGVSAMSAPDRDRQTEAKMAESWYRNLAADAFL